MTDVENKRLLRKIAKKDRKIVALEKRIRQLEAACADRSLNLTRAIESSIERVLCNVRMIPILGIGANSKIVEVNISDRSKQRGHI